MKTREIILYFAIKYNGNWDSIYKAISEKEEIDDQLYDNLIDKYKDVNYITIIDQEYPTRLKNITYPPFILFYKGDINLLNSNYIIGVNINTTASLSGLGHEKDFIDEFNKQNVTIVSDNLHQRPKKYIQVSQLDIMNIKNPVDGVIITEHINGNGTDNKYARIISGMAKQMLIIENNQDDEVCNLLAHYGLMYGVDVYCIPHDIYDQYIGNTLIEQGAYITLSPQQLIDNWGNI